MSSPDFRPPPLARAAAEEVRYASRRLRRARRLHARRPAHREADLPRGAARRRRSSAASRSAPTPPCRRSPTSSLARTVGRPSTAARVRLAVVEDVAVRRRARRPSRERAAGRAAPGAIGARGERARRRPRAQPGNAVARFTAFATQPSGRTFAASAPARASQAAASFALRVGVEAAASVAASTSPCRPGARLLAAVELLHARAPGSARAAPRTFAWQRRARRVAGARERAPRRGRRRSSARRPGRLGVRARPPRPSPRARTEGRQRLRSFSAPNARRLRDAPCRPRRPPRRRTPRRPGGLPGRRPCARQRASCAARAFASFAKRSFRPRMQRAVRGRDAAVRSMR